MARAKDRERGYAKNSTPHRKKRQLFVWQRILNLNYSKTLIKKQFKTVQDKPEIFVKFLNTWSPYHDREKICRGMDDDDDEKHELKNERGALKFSGVGIE